MSSISSTPPDQKEGFFLLRGEKDLITKPRHGSQEKEEPFKKRDSLEKRGSFLKKGPLSESHSSRFMSPLSLQGHPEPGETVFAFSPRAKPESIDASAQLIKEYLGDLCPSSLFQVFGQIVHNQYAFVSPDSYVLTASLEKIGMLKPFLLGISHLIAPKSPLDHIPIRRLIEVGLRIIGHPRTQALIDSKELKNEIDSILAARAQNLKSPKFQELIYKAEEATILRRKNQTSSEELAKEGLNYLTPFIQHPEEDGKFQKIKVSCETDPFALQKTFLFSVYVFLLKENHLCFDKKQKESLVQFSLNILLSSEGASLLHVLKIKK
jgi:hypothetical protein